MTDPLGPFRLVRYIDDGKLPADNNWIENQDPTNCHRAQQLAICRLAARGEASRRDHEPRVLGQAPWA